MAPTGGFLESVFELRYEISGSKGKGQKEKSGLLNGADQYWIASHSSCYSQAGLC